MVTLAEGRNIARERHRYIFEKGEGGGVRIHEGKAPLAFGDEKIGLFVSQIFATGGKPSLDAAHPERSDGIAFSKDLQVGEALFILASVPPNTATKEILEISAQPHSDRCLDFGVVLQGEADVLFADGSRSHLAAGDFFVQAGTLHAWHNPTDKPFLFAAVLVGAQGERQEPDGGIQELKGLA